MQTDVDFRAEGYLGVLSEAEHFEPAHADGSLDENPFGVRSLREMKCEEVGLPVFRYLFKRKGERDAALLLQAPRPVALARLRRPAL